jgi:hypothetical protein
MDAIWTSGTHAHNGIRPSSSFRSISGKSAQHYSHDEPPPACRKLTPSRLSQGPPQSQDSSEELEQYAARANRAGRVSVALTVASDTGVGAPVASLDPRPKRGAARAKGMKEGMRNASMIKCAPGTERQKERKERTEQKGRWRVDGT